MALPIKIKLPDNLIEEYEYYQSVTLNPDRTTTGSANFTNPRTAQSYSVVAGGQEALALDMFNNDPILKDYIFDDESYQTLRNSVSQSLNTLTPTSGTSTTITVTVPTTYTKFNLEVPVTITGGAITVNGLPLYTDYALTEQATELEAGIYTLFDKSTAFYLAPKGGLKSFFGDGSDGAIPDLNLVTTAPNGGTVANLFDMNAGTVFTTGTLSSASDQVVFSIDFGSPQLITGNTRIWQTLISTGANRNACWQYSDDGINYTDSNLTAISTTITDRSVFGQTNPHRYWRLTLKAGGSNCTISMQGISINYDSSIPQGTQTTRIWNIIEPSTLNGEAIVKQYTEYNLPVGYLHTVQNPNQGLIIYSQGNVTVDGVVDMSQKASMYQNRNIIPMVITNFKVTDPVGIQQYNELTIALEALYGGLGGNGGYGGGSITGLGRSLGGTGNLGRQNLGGFGGGGGGGAFVASGSVTSGRKGGNIIYPEIGAGQLDLATWEGSLVVPGYNGCGGRGANNGANQASTGQAKGAGSGGCGASYGASVGGTGNGDHAGGFILIICKNSITINGIIRANGGSGSNGGSGAQGFNIDGRGGSGGGGGGGAGGGVVLIMHKGVYTNLGTIQVSGGSGGSGGSRAPFGTITVEVGGPGTSGSVGTIAIQQL